MTATERLLNCLKRGEVLHTWDVHHTALAACLAKGLIIVTDGCLISLQSDVDSDRENLRGFSSAL